MSDSNDPFVTTYGDSGQIVLDQHGYLGNALVFPPPAFPPGTSSPPILALGVVPAVIGDDTTGISIGKIGCDQLCCGCDDSRQLPSTWKKCVNIPPPPPPPSRGLGAPIDGGDLDPPPPPLPPLSLLVFPAAWIDDTSSTEWPAYIPDVGARGPLRWYDSVERALGELPKDPVEGYVYYVFEVSSVTTYRKLGDEWVPFELPPPAAVVAVPVTPPMIFDPLPGDPLPGDPPPGDLPPT